MCVCVTVSCTVCVCVCVCVCTHALPGSMTCSDCIEYKVDTTWASQRGHTRLQLKEVKVHENTKEHQGTIHTLCVYMHVALHSIRVLMCVCMCVCVCVCMFACVYTCVCP